MSVAGNFILINCSLCPFSRLFRHRLLNEKRDANDAIELLKLIGRHQGIGGGGKTGTEHRPFSPSSSTTSLSTMSSFSSNNQQ